MKQKQWQGLVNWINESLLRKSSRQDPRARSRQFSEQTKQERIAQYPLKKKQKSRKQLP